MKKYLFGFLAIIAAVGFSAFTKPVKNAFTNYYRFTYISSNGFTEGVVEDERPDKWGYGTLVTQLDDFTLACDDVNDKACEIIVPEASVVPVTVGGVTKYRIKSTQAGDVAPNLVQIDATLGTESLIFKVDQPTSVNVLARMNKN